MRAEVRISLLVVAHVVLVIASVFVMDWAIRDRASADLWAVSRCTDLLCVSAPLGDSHATTLIWQTLSFTAFVLWQGGSRAFGTKTRPWATMAGLMIGAVGVLSVVVMAATFARSGLTAAPLVLGAAYLVGFVVLASAVRNELATHLARARQVGPARASRRG